MYDSLFSISQRYAKLARSRYKRYMCLSIRQSQVDVLLKGLNVESCKQRHTIVQQEGLAVASIARDDPSILPGVDLSPSARMHRDHNAR